METIMCMKVVLGPPDLYWFEEGQIMTLGNEEDINNLGPGTYNLLSIDAAGVLYCSWSSYDSYYSPN